MNPRNLTVLLIAITAFSCRVQRSTDTTDTSYTGISLTENTRKSIDIIDSLIRGLISDKKTAGFAYGIKIGESAIISKQYGLADIEKRLEVQQANQFRIASVTKPITATTALKLVETGKLSLSDPLSKFFPNYPNGQNITIYHLLSHTSGIPNWWDGELPKDAPTNFPMCDNPHLYLQKMKKSSLFDPGQFYSYSNSGYVHLGEIISLVSDLTYEETLKKYIFQPSGMINTEMEFIDHPSKNWIKGYALKKANEIPFIEPEVYHMPFSAGGLRSDVKDLINFVSALKSGKIISKELFHKMIEYAKLNNGKPVYEGLYVAINGNPPKPQENIYKRGYGFGFNLMELYNTHVYYHSGGIAGFNSYLIHIPKTNTTIVLLANTEDGIIPALKGILKEAVQIENQN